MKLDTSRASAIEKDEFVLTALLVFSKNTLEYCSNVARLKIHAYMFQFWNPYQYLILLSNNSSPQNEDFLLLRAFTRESNVLYSDICF